MSAPVTAAELRAQLLPGADVGEGTGGSASARLLRALEAIGWRGGDVASPEEVAAEILPALSACARGQGDISALYRQIADVLRANGPVMDGGLPPTSAYLPAATEIVRRFVGRS
jgi:hypothetical protein